MTFLQIMREAYIMRRAGVSAQVALMAACGEDDRCWNLLWHRLMQAAILERNLKRFER
ncbi:MAG: hypothetical protein J2P55_01160 [Rhizobiales bacterium]|nr:hypothetical protein [Hyphomicrobiales bacterium]